MAQNSYLSPKSNASLTQPLVFLTCKSVIKSLSVNTIPLPRCPQKRKGLYIWSECSPGEHILSLPSLWVLSSPKFFIRETTKQLFLAHTSILCLSSCVLHGIPPRGLNFCNVSHWWPTVGYCEVDDGDIIKDIESGQNLNLGRHSVGF